jgi:hypothetical protein
VTRGKVEGLVKPSRANFMTPIPVAASYERRSTPCWPTVAASASSERAGRHTEHLIGQRLAADLAALRRLPPRGPEPVSEKRIARVSSTALVRYRGNDHSVPTAYGFQAVLVKGFVDEVGDPVRRRSGQRPAICLVRPGRVHLTTCCNTWPLIETRRASTRLPRCRTGIRRQRSNTCATFWRRAHGQPR